MQYYNQDNYQQYPNNFNHNYDASDYSNYGNDNSSYYQQQQDYASHNQMRHYSEPSCHSEELEEPCGLQQQSSTVTNSKSIKEQETKNINVPVLGHLKMNYPIQN